MEDYLGTIKLFAGQYEPQNWTFCDGRLMSISGNETLFSILMTRYGGDGVMTFCLPDLRGRVPIGIGEGIGLSVRGLGEMGGAAKVYLRSNDLPVHNHAQFVSKLDANLHIPENSQSSLAPPTREIKNEMIQTLGFSDDVEKERVALDPATIGSSGGSKPHYNVQPSFGLNYIICVRGYYPSNS